MTHDVTYSLAHRYVISATISVLCICNGKNEFIVKKEAPGGNTKRQDAFDGLSRWCHRNDTLRRMENDGLERDEWLHNRDHYSHDYFRRDQKLPGLSLQRNSNDETKS